MPQNFRAFARGISSSFIAPFILLLTLFGNPAQAQTSSAVANGVQWLNGQVQGDGSLKNESQSIATPMQNRAEAAQTLQLLSTLPASLPNNVNAIADSNTQYLARKIIVSSLAHADVSTLLTILAQHQNPDGGYGGAPGYASNPIDTAFALIALNSTGQTTAAQSGIAYLQSQQQTDGSVQFENQPDLYTSIYALSAFRLYAASAPVGGNIQTLVTYLMKQQSAPGIWNGSTLLTALAYSSLHDFIPLSPTATSVSTYLIAEQLPDGSWADDPYVSALALRALAMTAVSAADPGLGQVKGVLLDVQTRLPLVGVTIAGSNGISSLTDSTGSFIVQNVAPGAFQLSLTLSQYQTLNTSFTLQAGQVLDLGTLLMTKGANATTGTVLGVVRDAASNQPVPGVAISINGGASAVTDATGAYQVSNVSPGNVTMSATKGGYATAGSTGLIVAGSSLNFSPLLTTAYSGVTSPAVQGVILRAADNSALAGVTISVTGSNVATTVTGASGQYGLGSLSIGPIQIVASLAGYDSVTTNTQVTPNGNIAFSPKMYPTNTTPPGQNAAGVQGVVMDAGTNAVLSGAQVTISIVGQPDTVVTTGADGRFSVPGITAASVTLTANLQKYATSVLQVPMQPLQVVDVGQIRLRLAKIVQLLPDLQVTSASRMFAITNSQTLTLSGNVVAIIANAGTAPASTDIAVMAFYDVNGNGTYDPNVDVVLGSTTIAGGIAAGANQTISIPVAGNLPFRDAPIQVWVDSTNAVIESNKANNVRSTAFAAELLPTIANFDPVLKWQWTGSSVLPTSFNVIMAPVVAPLYDTNGDGKIDQNDTPSVAFISYAGPVGSGSPGNLRIISGKDGSDIVTVADPQYQLEGYSNLAIADIDGSGHPAIVGIRNRSLGGGLIAFNADGTVRWTSVPSYADINSNYAWGAPTIADLDGDGKSEIIYGNQVFNGDGSLRWSGSTNYIGQNNIGNVISISLPVVADINQDGNPVVLLGASAYDKNGKMLWQNNAVGDGFVAVANFSGSTYPQIVVVSHSAVYLLDRQGNIIWGPVAIPGGGAGGPPTIADMNGDGIPEIGVAGGGQYTAYQADGSILWSKHTQDLSSGVTGSTVFDFLGNGHAEVLYGDETTFRIYNGQDGSLLFSTPNPSGTAVEYPLVVDLDNGGHADFLVVSNDYQSANIHGVRAYQDRKNAWVNTRGIWNEHAYHITNVNDNASIPAVETNSWTQGNNYRANLPSILYSCVAPVMLLNETFTQPDASVWTILNGRGTSIGGTVNGQYQRTGAGASTVGSVNWGDYTAEVDLQFPNGASSDAGLAFRVAGPNQWYALSVQSNSLNLVQYNQGTFTILQQVPVQLSGDATTAHSLAVQVVGTTVNAYLDNTLLITYANLAWTQGAVGTQQGNVEALYSLVKVTSYAPPFSQDVSASDVRVVDGGVSPSTLTVRIGNTGSLNVPLGIPVSFYGTNAASGQQTLLGTATTTTVLQPNQYQDVNFIYSSLGSLTQLTVHANDDGTGKSLFQECDLTNNTDSISLPVLPGSFSLTAVGTDQPNYSANSNVQIAAILANQGSFNGNATVRFVIQNASGQQVATLPTQVVAVAGGGRQTVNAVWNDGTVAAGSYVLVAQLLDGNGTAYSQKSTAFAITSTSGSGANTQASVALATDKQTYQPGDSVNLSDRLTNLTTNTALNNLSVVTSVLSPSGAAVFSKTETLAQLQAAALKNYAYSLPLGSAAAGVYTASVVVTAADGSTVAQANAGFTVASSSASGSGLTGSISVATQQVQIGNPLALSFSATNGGNSALTGLPLTVTILDPVSQKVIASYPTTQTLAIGASYAGSDSWTAAGTVGNTYVAVLGATVGGNAITLAQTNFTLIAPPIKLAITQALWNGNRVLALTACNDSGATTVTTTTAAATCSAKRYVAIDTALTSLGVPHLITTNAAAFTQAMRSGLYDTLWIAGDQSLVGDALTAEIDEAVYYGDTLIVDGAPSQCNATFDTFGGITARTSVASNLNVTLNGPFYATAQTLPTVGTAQSFTVTGGAQVQGTFAVSKSGSTQNVAAIVSNTVGAGRTLIAGFDLGATLAAQTAQSTPAIAWNAALGTTLNAITPLATASLTPGQVLPVQTVVTNQGVATTVDTQMTLAPGAQYLGATPTATLNAAGNIADWGYNLAVAQSEALDISMRAPGSGGSYNLQTVVGTVAGGGITPTSTPYGNALAFPFTVTPAATHAANAIAALQALTLSAKADQTLRTSLIANINQAMSNFNLNTFTGYGTAIGETVGVSGSLSASVSGFSSAAASANSSAINGIRAEVDRILQEAQWRWTLTQPEVSSTLNLDKTSCQPSDTVTLSETVTNITTGTTLTKLQTATTITGPGSTVVFTKTESLAQLAVGARQAYSYPVALANDAPGAYQVSMIVSDANGNTLAQSSGQFTVASTATTGAGLSGTVQVSPQQVPLGSAAVITIGALDQGNSALTALPLTLAIVNSATQKTVAQFPYSATLAIGGSYTASSSWTATGTTGTAYQAVLSATLGPLSLQLAQAPFTVIAPPVQLSITQNQAAWQNLLIYSACKRATDGLLGQCGATALPVDNPATLASCDSNRAAMIEQTLGGLGVSHSIVTDAATFLAKLRSGQYNGYWISNGATVLPEPGASELRAAVTRGGGLIVDGLDAGVNPALATCAGVAYKAPFAAASEPLSITGKLYNPGNFTITAAPAQLSSNSNSNAGATVQATLGSGASAGIVDSVYGNGKTLAFGFDWATTLNTQASNKAWPAIAQASMNYVEPAAASSTQFIAGDSITLATSVQNTGQAANLQVVQTLPAGATVASTSPVAQVGGNSVTWTAALPQGASQVFALRLQAPIAAGSYAVGTSVNVVSNGKATPYQSENFAFTVQGASDLMTQLIAAVQTHNTGSAQQQAVATAVLTQLGTAQSALSASHSQDEVLRLLLSAQSRLAAIDSGGTLEPLLANLIAAVERQTAP